MSLNAPDTTPKDASRKAYRISLSVTLAAIFALYGFFLLHQIKTFMAIAKESAARVAPPSS